MELSDGSRIGVIGGGPAGSLVGYFLPEMARLVYFWIISGLLIHQYYKTATLQHPAPTDLFLLQP